MTSEEIYTELNQYALQFLKGRLDVAKEEQTSAKAEGRPPLPALKFGMESMDTSDELSKRLVEFNEKITRKLIRLEREAVLHAVAEYINRRGAI